MVENYCAAVEDATTITWNEFVKEFRRYHIPAATVKRKADEFCALQQESMSVEEYIPAATMKRKADEFHELQQGSMSMEQYTYQFMELARYALEEVDKDEKK